MPSMLRCIATILATALLLLAAPVRAADPPAFTAEQLDQMLAPIALFPDALLSQVLMATTYPSDVAQAVDWAFANRTLQGDEAVKAVQGKPWDPSVQSLVAFPQVLAMLGEKPEWVRDLGDAFLAQPEAVMDSVQFLRSMAKNAGNLSSNEQQIVTVEAAPPPRMIVDHAPPQPTQIIAIAPANPQVIFVPVYNPVYVFGPWWHPMFPPFFFPPPPRWGFGWNPVGTAIWWGVGIGVTYALWGGVDWRRRNVNINVNQWNNININNRITSNNRNVNWNHNPGNRRDIPYRDGVTRDRLQQNRIGERGGRQDYRGREDQRAQARAALGDRLGAENLDRNALRDIDRSQIPQRLPEGSGASVRDRAANIDRGQLQDRAAGADRQQVQNRAGNIDRSQVQNRAAKVDRSQVQDRVSNIDRAQAQDRAANFDRSQVQNRAAGVDRDQARDRAANIDRSQVQNRAANVDRSRAQDRNASAARNNRDNALRGANDGRQLARQSERGTASQAAQRRAATDRNRNAGRHTAGAAGDRRR